MPVSFRLLQEDDLPRLIAWLAQPHNATWWGSATQNEIRAKYLPRLRGETTVRVYAILLDLEPVGMAQAYPVTSEAEADACGMDLLIGNPSLIGRDLGSRVIGEFVTDELFGRLGFSVCIADPDATNQRSIRAFEKAGFVHRRFENGGGVIANILARKAARVEALSSANSHDNGPGPKIISAR